MATTLTKKQKAHPFYCYKKMCRKTAWDTPEYMSEDDWAFLKKAYDIIIKKDLGAFTFLRFENPQLWDNFFNHALGWPEGGIYCRKYEYVVKTFVPMVSKHELPFIEKALQSHLQKTENSP